ncbi:MAG: hypothetical protein ACYDBT_15000 [Desulfobulbaceae bacterium]
MNQSRYGFLRALLITFGLISLIGIVWYFTMLSTTSLVCGITTFISGFALGIADLQKKTSVLRSATLALFSLAGTLASVVQIYHDSNVFSDLWGAFPWLFPLILFATSLKIIIKNKNISQNNKDLKQAQLTSLST